MSVSQKVVIDSINKTVLLPKSKVITVGKIIQNEEALFKENQLLRKALANIKEQLEQSEKQIDIYLSKYQEAKQTVEYLQNKIIASAENQLEIEVKNRPIGFYGFAKLGTSPNPEMTNFFIGLQMVNRKTLYSFSINPANEKPIYMLGIGYKLF